VKLILDKFYLTYFVTFSQKKLDSISTGHFAYLGTACMIDAEVVTFVAGSLEAGGLPGYPEVFLSLK
jgi:hypothetical protein